MPSTLLAADGIMPQIEHVVVLMMENRSFDNLLGWLYPEGQQPAQFFPAGSPQVFNGLNTGSYSNSDPAVNGGQPVQVANGTTSWTIGGGNVPLTCVPTPDPGEVFDDVNVQIADNMSGFLTNFVTQVDASGGPAASAAMIMQSYSTEQVPVLSQLAASFAVSDAWFASVPSQTWPNRAFLLTGSSAGVVNNELLLWARNSLDMKVIFDVLDAQNLSWMVYNDGPLTSLVKTMFLKKYLLNETNFGSIQDFQSACQQPGDAPSSVKLPPFSFLEPNFGIDFAEVNLMPDESYHPPHDIRPGEQFLATIYETIMSSPYRDEILFVVLFDEHGGTYDHVPPPSGAAEPFPDPVATDGSGFTFDRFGARVPALVISSYVTPGTVFRSSTDVPLDHTSLLATLRDWLGLAQSFSELLPSPRIAAAPTLAAVLTETSPQPWPTLSLPSADELAAIRAIPETADEVLLNDVQRAVLVGTAARVAGRPYTEEEGAVAYERLRTYRDARAWLAALQPHLPLR